MQMSLTALNLHDTCIFDAVVQTRGCKWDYWLLFHVQRYFAWALSLHALHGKKHAMRRLLAIEFTLIFDTTQRHV